MPILVSMEWSVDGHSKRGDVRGESELEAENRLREVVLAYMEENVVDEIELSDVFDGVDYEDTLTAEANAEGLIVAKLKALRFKPSRGSPHRRELRHRKPSGRVSSPRNSLSELLGAKFVDSRSDKIDDLFDRS